MLVDDWYVKSNRFGHYLVFDGEESDMAKVVDALEHSEVQVRYWKERQIIHSAARGRVEAGSRAAGDALRVVPGGQSADGGGPNFVVGQQPASLVPVDAAVSRRRGVETVVAEQLAGGEAKATFDLGNAVADSPAGRSRAGSSLSCAMSQFSSRLSLIEVLQF